MASGFTYAKALSILQTHIESDTYVCLSTSTPDLNGGNFNEPATSAGYIRQKIGAIEPSGNAQISNKNIIFLFEALSDCGTITHIGLSDSETRGSPVFLVAELTAPVTVPEGYVPLIRAGNLKIGLS